MKDNTVVKRIVDYIESHLNEDLSLDTISADLSYSKFYISRIFAEKTGCTVYKYIQRRRLSIAAQKLAQTRQPIIEIAYEARYSSQQAFTLAFQQLYLCTPQTYRKNGFFYPKQTRLFLQTSLCCYSGAMIRKGGKMAA